MKPKGHKHARDPAVKSETDGEGLQLESWEPSTSVSCTAASAINAEGLSLRYLHCRL
jgi:hypothetical protein